MLALGLAAVPFFKYLKAEYTVASIALPQTDSGETLVILPRYSKEMGDGGGGWGGYEKKSLKTVNTLKNEKKLKASTNSSR